MEQDDDETSGLTKRELADSIIRSERARGATQAEAAARAGVGERSVRRREADPAFSRSVQLERRQLLEQANGRVAGRLGEAVDTMADLMRSADADGVRLAAAKALIAAGGRIEIQQLAARVETVERAINSVGGNDPDPIPGWTPLNP